MDSSQPSKAFGERMANYRAQIERMIKYKRTGLHHPGLTYSQQKTVRNQAATHRLKEGKVFYVGDKKRGAREVVLTVERALEVVSQCHAKDSASHHGINTTLARVSEHYWWYNMKLDIVEYVKGCAACQKEGRNKIRPPKPTPPPIKVSEPMELVGIDFIGPLPATPKGNEYICSMTDYFSKFLDLFPLPTKDAAGVCTCIKTFINRWGAPKNILCDEGKEFITQLNMELCTKFNIRQLVAPALHPETNGLDEPIKIRLSELTAELKDPTCWDEVLDDVAFSIRTQRRECTNYSPFFLMFGRHPRLSMKVKEENDICEEEITPEVTSEAVGAFVQLRQKQIEATDIKMEEKQAKAKEERKTLLAGRKSQGTQTKDKRARVQEKNQARAQEKQKALSAGRKSQGMKTFNFKMDNNHVLQNGLWSVGKKGAAAQCLWTGPYMILEINKSQGVQQANPKDNRLP